MMYLLLLLLIAGILLSSHLLTRRYGFQHIEYQLQFDKNEVTEGETVTLIERICSRKALPVPWLKVEMTTHASLKFARSQSTVSESTRFISSFFALHPYRQIERRWQVECTQRGIFSVAHIILVITDLFGTLELSKALHECAATLTVLPSPMDFTLPQPLTLPLNGQPIKRRLIPDRMAMDGLRPYQDGEPIRDICWSATARFDTPMVYQFLDTVQPSITVVLNMTTREYDRDFASDLSALEQAIKLCTALIEQGQALQIPTRFCANTAIDHTNVNTQAAKGASHIHHLLQILAALPNTITERFSNLLCRICQQEHHAAIYVVTALVDEELLRLAALYPNITVVTIRQLSPAHRLPNLYSAACSANR